MDIKKIILLSTVFFIVNKSYASVTVTDDKKVVKDLVSASQSVTDLATTQSQMVVNAVFLASQLMGNTRVVSAGTLTQYAPDLRSFSYDAFPQDSLIVKIFNGDTFRFQIQDFHGDYTSGPNNFLSGAHRLKFTGQKENHWQLNVSSLQQDGQRLVEATGNALYEETNYQFDLKLAGNYYFEIDHSGFEYRSQYQILGTIDSALKKFQINETHDGRFVSARDNHGRSTIVSSSDRQSSNQVRIGADLFQLSNARICKVFRNGKPSDPDFWLGSGGNIIKNSQSIATISATYELPYAKIKAFFTNGENLDLESWLIDTTT